MDFHGRASWHLTIPGQIAGRHTSPHSSDLEEDAANEGNLGEGGSFGHGPHLQAPAPQRKQAAGSWDLGPVGTR